jgi:hypothetical protein
MDKYELLSAQLDIFDSMNDYRAILGRAINDGENDIDRFEKFLDLLKYDGKDELMSAFTAKACNPATPGSGTNPDIAALSLQFPNENDAEFISERIMSTLVLSILSNTQFDIVAAKSQSDVEGRNKLFPSFYSAVSKYEVDVEKVGPKQKKQCARVCKFAEVFLNKIKDYKTWREYTSSKLGKKDDLNAFLIASKKIGLFAGSIPKADDKQETAKTIDNSVGSGKNNRFP